MWQSQLIIGTLIAATVPALSLAPPAALAAVSVDIAVNLAPPPLPVYVQPPLPGPGYIWTPGYWAYGTDGYYWVPGTWVLPPAVGLLWTPGYWGWGAGGYVWHVGYWGPHIGFYGGINYGFGYVGTGYLGGYWDHGAWFYNRAANNFGAVNVTNVYNKTVINNTVNRVSYNGGNGGVTAQPTAEQLAATHEQHMPPTGLQAHHEQIAAGNHSLLAAVNHGHPQIAATSRPGVFHGSGVVAAAHGSKAPQSGASLHGAHVGGTPQAGFHSQSPRAPMHGPNYGAGPHQQFHPPVAQHPNPMAQHANGPNYGAGPHQQFQPRMTQHPNPMAQYPNIHPAAPHPRPFGPPYGSGPQGGRGDQHARPAGQNTAPREWRP